MPAAEFRGVVIRVVDAGSTISTAARGGRALALGDDVRSKGAVGGLSGPNVGLCRRPLSLNTGGRLALAVGGATRRKSLPALRRVPWATGRAVGRSGGFAAPLQLVVYRWERLQDVSDIVGVRVGHVAKGPGGSGRHGQSQAVAILVHAPLQRLDDVIHGVVAQRRRVRREVGRRDLGWVRRRRQVELRGAYERGAKRRCARGGTSAGGLGAE